MRFGISATSLILPKNFRMRLRPTSVLAILTSLLIPPPTGAILPAGTDRYPIGLLTDQCLIRRNYCSGRPLAVPALPPAALAAERDDGPWGKPPRHRRFGRS